MTWHTFRSLSMQALLAMSLVSAVQAALPPEESKEHAGSRASTPS